MIRSKIWKNKAFWISLIFTLILSANCTMYRNMRPTGEYTTISKEKIQSIPTFRLVKMPEPKAPTLVVAYGEYPAYKETQNVKKVGQMKTSYASLWLAVAAGGIGYMISGRDEKFENPEEVPFYKSRVATGVLIGIVGIASLTKDLGKPWVAAYKDFYQEVLIEDEKDFQFRSNKKIKASCPLINKDFELITNERGHVHLNLAELIDLVPPGAGLEFNFKTEEPPQASNSFNIPASFFSDLKAYYASIRPPDLITMLSFDDVASWKPNQIIDGAEKAFLVATIENRGEGKALDVKLNIANTNPRISFQSDYSIGTIEPGKKVEQRIPVFAAMDITDGKATFTAYTREQRGYDAKPFQLNLNVRHLDKPALSFTSFKLNDGTTGMASGNNNNIAESDETVEVIAFVKNSGVGAALNAQLEVSDATLGIQLKQSKSDLGTIAPGETKQGKIVFYIPRTFAAQQIKLNFAAQDMLGASVLKQTHLLPVKSRAPFLAIEKRILTRDGVQVNQVSNGNDYLLEIKPRNDGSITAYNITISVSATDRVQLSETSRFLSQIAAGTSSGILTFPFSLPRTFGSPEVNLNVKLSQSDFDPIYDVIKIPTVIRKPQLAVQTSFTNSRGEALIRQGDYAELNITVQNVGDLDAENVIASFELNDPGIDFREPEKNFGRIPAGTPVGHKFRFYVKNSARVGSIASTLKIRQADGFPGIDKPLSLQIAEAGAIVITVPGQEVPTPPPATGTTLAGRLNEKPRVKVKPLGVNESNQTFASPIRIDITISDDKPLLVRDPEIYVNGKLQLKEILERGIDLTERSQAIGEKELRLVRSIQLEEGKNRIEVRYMDSDNESDADFVDVEYHTSRADVYALVVGVSEYALPAEKIERLRYAHRDAQRFADFLTSPAGGNVSQNHIKILTNTEATRANIFKSLNQVLGQALENDVVYLYLAMHAKPDNSGQTLFFLTYDSDPDEPYGTAISQYELQGILQNAIHSKKVVWIADACHSGTIGTQEIGQRASRYDLTNRLLNEMAKARPGIAMLLATSASQTSKEGDKWNGGVFTHYLIQGMKGAADEDRNGFVTLAELSRYVKRAVAEATNGQQTPVFGGDLDRSMPLGIGK